MKERNWKPNQLRILRSDVGKYIESDKDVIDLSLRISYRDATTKYLEDIIKQINTRNFIIKIMIDFIRFQQGG